MAPSYIEGSKHETEVPNIVTTVLASYRSFDTFGETTVVLTAMVGAMVLLGGSMKREEDEAEAARESQSEDS